MHIPLPVGGEVAAALFQHVPAGDEVKDALKECPAVCLDRGVDADLVPYAMPEKYYDNENNADHTTFLTFIASNSCGRVEVALLNYSPKVLDLYWVDEQNDKDVFLYKLQREEHGARFINTYNGHRFRAKDPDTGEILFDEVIEFMAAFGIGNHVNPHRDRDIRNQVKRVMDGEWVKKQKVTRTFSPLGFDKGRLPNDLFGSMRSFYYNNR